MKVDPLFDGWWTVRYTGEYCKHYCCRPTIVQVHAGEEWDPVYDRGPWPTREDAEGFEYVDHLAGYWERGLAVYADHCLGCGTFARVLAFDNGADRAWRVTECKDCGIIDSRDHSCFTAS